MSDDDGVLWRYGFSDDDEVTVHDGYREGVMVTLGYCFQFLPPKQARRMAKKLKKAAKSAEEDQARAEAERSQMPCGPISATNSVAGVVEFTRPWGPQ